MVGADDDKPEVVLDDERSVKSTSHDSAFSALRFRATSAAVELNNFENSDLLHTFGWSENDQDEPFAYVEGYKYENPRCSGRDPCLTTGLLGEEALGAWLRREVRASEYGSSIRNTH